MKSCLPGNLASSVLLLALSLWAIGCSPSEATYYVYVNAVDKVGDVECDWMGSQRFSITDGHIEALVDILPYGETASSYVVFVAVFAVSDEMLLQDSVDVDLFETDDGGSHKSLTLSTNRPPTTSGPRPDEVTEWRQRFDVSPEMTDDTEGAYILKVKADYITSDGTVSDLDVEVPLRRVQITTPVSL